MQCCAHHPVHLQDGSLAPTQNPAPSQSLRPPPPATCYFCLPGPATLYQWNRSLCGLLRLLACSLGTRVFEVRPLCSACQRDAPFHACVLVHCRDGRILFVRVSLEGHGLLDPFGDCGGCCCAHGAVCTCGPLCLHLPPLLPSVTPRPHPAFPGAGPLGGRAVLGARPLHRGRGPGQRGVAPWLRLLPAL